MVSLLWLCVWHLFVISFTFLIYVRKLDRMDFETSAVSSIKFLTVGLVSVTGCIPTMWLLNIIHHKHYVSSLANIDNGKRMCSTHSPLQMFVEVETSSISMAQYQLAVVVCMTSTGRTRWRGVKVQWRRELPLILVYCRCVLIKDKVFFGIKSQQNLLQEAGRSFGSTLPSFPDHSIQSVYKVYGIHL